MLPSAIILVQLWIFSDLLDSPSVPEATFVLLDAHV